MKNKISMFVLFLALTAISFAEQIVVHVKCVDGKADTRELEKKLQAGYKVVSAVPVTDSDSVTVVGKPKQAYTASIVYILDRY